MLQKVSAMIAFEGEGDITGEVIVESTFVGVEGITGAGVEGGDDDTEADSGAELPGGGQHGGYFFFSPLVLDGEDGV